MAWVAAIAKGGAEAYKAFQLKGRKIEEAEAYRDAKNRHMAGTTREMSEEARNKELMHSRAVALAAASGGGVDDPGVVKILGDLNAEGEYRIMSLLWSGQNAAEGLLYRAEQATKEANSAMTAGIINALTAGTEAYYGAGGGKGSFGGATKVTAKKSTASALTPRPIGFEAERWGF